MEDFDHILLFKTNLKTERDRLAIKSALDRDANIHQWNVDLKDIDCVLRVISYTLRHQQIIELLRSHGYECSELI